ncbi:MAG: hypothetical protein JWM90_2428 [Thermoleophilia bacterium]|nr:hypothetical protein [Thermoleophilia bacterium]
MQITAATSFDKLITLTAPGAAVAPVVAELDSAAASLRAARPVFAQAQVSAQLLGELDRIQGAAATLRNALHELEHRDGMTVFDAAQSADDVHWDAWFTRSAELIRSATAQLTG